MANPGGAPAIPAAGGGASLDAAIAAVAAQVAALPTLEQIKELIQQNFSTIAGPVAAIVLNIAAARARNAHDRRGEPYAVVPLADGNAPANWPVGFDRTALVEGAVAAVDTLLADYGLPHGAGAGSSLVRRNALASHIGTSRS